MSEPSRSASLCWVHVGDLHITERHCKNYRDFLVLVQEINQNLARQVNFVVLPGDNADDGTPDQYALIRAALSSLNVPVHIIPGDHDFNQGSLANFYQGLSAEQLPMSVLSGGYRCIFLDAVSRGGGGPDFHLGDEQLRWLDGELKEATAQSQPKVVFVHAYPADFPRDCRAFRDMLRAYQVRIVDMGHTHYNELTNDGTTLFATTRSTGQIEEGPVGFSVFTLTESIVNWRFKPLGSSWPLVMITTPGDYRLQVDDPSGCDTTRRRRLKIAARVWGAADIKTCRYRINEGAWHPMTGPDPSGEWTGWCESPAGRCSLEVMAMDSLNSRGSDVITVSVPRVEAPVRTADGSDADALEAWPERHLLGTRLGPNRNGRQW